MSNQLVSAGVLLRLSKGNRVNIPEPGGGKFNSGNTNEFRDAGGGPEKSFLFFLTAYYPGIRLPGDRVKWLAKHFKF